MKNLVKNLLPKPLYQFLRSHRDWLLLSRLVKYDKRKYYEFYTKPYKEVKDKAGLEANTIFYIHQIEKGLSHTKFRNGFGVQPLRNMRNELEKIEDHSSLVYKAALSSISAYVNIHEKNHYDVDKQKSIIGKKLLKEASSCKSSVSGYIDILKGSSISGKDRDFKELFTNRYSVREFSDSPVDYSKIYNAIGIAMKTPSVCNRQSYRVILVKNAQIIKELLLVQNGFKGYSLPPVLAVVLTDTRSFRGVNEYHNTYIDGGLFLMSFLLSLEYEGLAACALNTMFSVKEDKTSRKILELASNYNFISYVAIGNFRDVNRVAKSFRLKPENITRTIE